MPHSIPQQQQQQQFQQAGYGGMSMNMGPGPPAKPAKPHYGQQQQHHNIGDPFASIGSFKK
jgi:hypothetical protein